MEMENELIKNLNKKELERLFAIIGLSVLFSAAILSVILSRLFTDIESFKSLFTNGQGFRVLFLGIVVTFIFCLSYVVIGKSHPKNMSKIKAFFIISFAVGLTVCVSLVTDLYFNRYARPFALAGIFIAVMINKRTAIYSEIIIGTVFILAEGLLVPISESLVVPTITSMFSGIIMTMLVAKDDKRIRTMFTVVLVIPLYALVTSALYFTYFEWSVRGLVSAILQSAVAPVITGFVYIGILPVFEGIFKVTTPYYLTEITDINKGLLLKLSQDAPGTFNHSMSVANLAASCALAIGEDARLARACGYYHDIGKMIDPSVFTENQKGGSNPHDKLTPELSVSLIKRHVQAGVELLKKHGFPKEIIAVAAEHHGTMPITYFYTKAKKFTDGYVDVKDYSYDGPLPSTKISAIIMICDACEAAVRSLPSRTKESIDEKVKGIIEERMELEQFDACEITFKDLQVIRFTLVDALSGVYHERIGYPKLRIMKKPDQGNTQDKQ